MKTHAVFFVCSFSPLPRYQEQLVSGSGGKSKLRYQKNPCRDSAEVIGSANMNIMLQQLLLAPLLRALRIVLHLQSLLC